MSTAVKTPGVYVYEKDAFGNSVVPVATAVPAFIGYTQQTSYNGKSVLKKAVKVSSFAEFQAIYGNEPPTVQYTISAVVGSPEVAADATTDKENAKGKPKKGGGKDEVQATPQGAGTGKPDFYIGDTGYTIAPKTVNYRLYSAMQLFYANGGGDCYVVSVGTYGTTTPPLSSKGDFTAAITGLVKEVEPTMLVIPDVVEFGSPTDYSDAYAIQQAMIDHCGNITKSRVALLDIPGGFAKAGTGDTDDNITNFRDGATATLGKFYSYAAAYYPWLNTTIYQPTDVSYLNFDKATLQGTVKTIITDEYSPPVPAGTPRKTIPANVMALITTLTTYVTSPTDKQLAAIQNADKAFRNLSSGYALLLNKIQDKLNLMPPSAAIAGVYTTVDNNIGVWKAPANVAVQSTISPAIKISHDQQEDLNVPIDGKSVCAIRAFKGYGNMVWGARTMDGNSNDWRYINVRRTLIFIEQSIKDAAKAYVFAPNDASTWTNVSSMIGNFLTGLWKQGALVGPKASDAYQVLVGLGTTMTNDDIQNGRMNVTVKVALSHPAEFIEITFQQEMQKA